MHFGFLVKLNRNVASDVITFIEQKKNEAEFAMDEYLVLTMHNVFMDFGWKVF